MKRGFQRLKIDGDSTEIADAPALDKKLKHDIEVVVDRIVVRPDMAARLAESFETALELADGLAVAEFADAAGGRERAAAHPVLLEIRLPGVGLHDRRDRAAALLVQQPVRRLPGLRRARHRAQGRSVAGRARPEATLNEGAIAPWAKSSSPYYLQTLEALPGTTSSGSTSRGASCRRRRARRSCTARATRRSASPTTTACAPTR